MTWVRQEHDRRQVVRNGAAALWQQLSTEISEAVKDYNELFCGGDEICAVKSCGRSNVAECLTVTKIDPANKYQAPREISVYMKGDVIARRFGPGSGGQMAFQIDAHLGSAALFFNDRPVETEEVCKMMLEPFLFGKAGVFGKAG